MERDGELGRYTILVRGRVGDRLDGMFAGLELRPRAGLTELVGPLVDQAQLFGLLTCLRDLGIELVSVNPAHAPTKGIEER
jgi:hypothetical protein